MADPCLERLPPQRDFDYIFLQQQRYFATLDQEVMSDTEMNPTDQKRFTRHFPVSWQELHRDAKALAWRLSSLSEIKGVVAVTRGGMVPAAIVARELNIRLIDTICVASYDEQLQGDISVLKSVEGDGEGLLIVDDLVDTGATAKIVRERLPKAHFASVYAKPAGRPLVDSYVTEVSQDTWIHFPWDTEAQYVAPIRGQD